jgi:hypothetical protein
MPKRVITLSLGVAFLIANASAFAWNNQQRGIAAKAPDLTKSCAKECPNAKNNDEALKCVEDMEKAQGEAAMKKRHSACYKAHEKYEKQTGKEEAGETAEKGESS